MSMLGNTTHLHDDKQITFLQEGKNRILSAAQILLVLWSHKLLSTIYDTDQFTHFIYYSSQDKFKNSRINKIQQVLEKLSNQQN